MTPLTAGNFASLACRSVAADVLLPTDERPCQRGDDFGPVSPKNPGAPFAHPRCESFGDPHFDLDAVYLGRRNHGTYSIGR